MENNKKTTSQNDSNFVSTDKKVNTTSQESDKTVKSEMPVRRTGGYQNNSYNANKSGGKPFTPYNKQNKYYKRKKFCKLCAKGIEHIDYKDVDTLNKYLNFSLKISSRKLTGACSSHQRKISNAIKRARIVALIPFVKE
ncbi:MAG: 30S ribosomal protein S18 [Malacoplasma sp.]